MSATGVLCTRVRVEEKQIIAALGDAGMMAMPVPPAGTPLPPGPASRRIAALGGVEDASSNDVLVQEMTSIIDRCQNRALAAATLPLYRALGIDTLDAGLASTGTRLQIATALAGAGIPRPACLAAFSEATGLTAADRIGFPSTLLSLTPGGAAIHLHDRDTADAVIEHRVVLGGDREAIFLIQAGAPAPEERTIVHVIDGRAIAVDGAAIDSAGLDLAETTAHDLGAALAAITIATVGAELVVWDVQPVGDFREARRIGETTVPAALASLVAARTKNAANGTAPVPADRGPQGWKKAMVSHGVAVTA